MWYFSSWWIRWDNLQLMMLSLLLMIGNFEHLKPKKIKWLSFEDYSKLEERYPNIEFFKSKFTLQDSFVPKPIK